MQIVSTGLKDIILPVKNLKTLLDMQPDFKLIDLLSRKYDVTGIHAFCLDTFTGCEAHTRNFAPRYGIPEESATGIDISTSSISYAQNKAVEESLPINYFCKDYLKEDIGTRYDAVICIYCDFGALVPTEQKILLDKIYHVLNDDGIFIFDVFKPGLCHNKKEKRDWHYSNGEDFWSSSPHLLLEEVKHFVEQKVWGTRTVIIEENRFTSEEVTFVEAKK